LDVATLCRAYRQGIFPWFGEDQPILWWSTHPRAVLLTDEFELSHSLKKLIRQLYRNARLELRVDTAFSTVIRACASNHRPNQSGTWIVNDMIQAYEAMHRAGHAHSVETWVDGRLCGGLYCISLGKMVFGESMFATVSNASKIALTGLIGICRLNGMPMIDCQQKTSHLLSLGARVMDRGVFLAQISDLVDASEPNWTQGSTEVWLGHALSQDVPPQ
jgi:leucyl/phenylalanyl-tRNA--protein transferase